MILIYQKQTLGIEPLFILLSPVGFRTRLFPRFSLFVVRPRGGGIGHPLRGRVGRIVRVITKFIKPIKEIKSICTFVTHRNQLTGVGPAFPVRDLGWRRPRVRAV